MGLSLTIAAPDSSQKFSYKIRKLLKCSWKSLWLSASFKIWHGGRIWPRKIFDVLTLVVQGICTMDQNWNFLKNFKFDFFRIRRIFNSKSMWFEHYWVLGFRDLSITFWCLSSSWIFWDFNRMTYIWLFLIEPSHFFWLF